MYEMHSASTAAAQAEISQAGSSPIAVVSANRRANSAGKRRRAGLSRRSTARTAASLGGAAESRSRLLVMIRVLIPLVLTGLLVFAVVDILVIDGGRVRGIPKYGWIGVVDPAPADRPAAVVPGRARAPRAAQPRSLRRASGGAEPSRAAVRSDRARRRPGLPRAPQPRAAAGGAHPRTREAARRTRRRQAREVSSAPLASAASVVGDRTARRVRALRGDRRRPQSRIALAGARARGRPVRACRPDRPPGPHR